MKGLNPYCNGRKNRIPILLIGAKVDVLILIVVEERIGSYQSSDDVIVFSES